MSTPENVSLISRFALKFVEIAAAGLATAASGYLIAHLSGILSAPASAPDAAVTTVVNGSMASGQPPQPVAPTGAETTQERSVPQQEADAPRAAGPTRRIVNSTKTQPAGKHLEKPAKGADTTRDEDALAARVRAALANADARRTEPLDNSLSGNFARQGAAIEQPPPLRARSDPAAISAAPPAAPELRPAPPPVEAKPPAAVETTLPVSQSPPTSANQTGMLSTLEQMLRHDPVANADEAPRPPMPIGQ